MHIHPVDIILPRRVLPLSAVVPEINFLDEFPKPPFLAGVTLRTLFSDDPGDFIPSLGFGHVLNQTDHLAASLAIDVPTADPATALLSDTSYGVPCTHNVSLCALAASFWRCIHIIICGFVALDPCGKTFAAH
jgi:hypothetical protein